MQPQHLTPRDLQLIGECLRAAADGPFFEDDREFSTLFGMSKADVRRIAVAWPAVEMSSNDVDGCVRASLGHLLSYPHRQERHWPQWISGSNQEVFDCLARWRGEAPRNPLEMFT